MSEERKPFRYVLESENCSKLAIDSFDEFLELARYGGMVNVTLLKNGKTYRFEADILKYMHREEKPEPAK